MAWTYKLDVSDVWQKVKDDKMKLSDFCALVVKRIDELMPKVDILDGMLLREIRDNLDALAVDSFPDVDDFDDIWKDLYNWADRARCWVATF